MRKFILIIFISLFWSMSAFSNNELAKNVNIRDIDNSNQKSEEKNSIKKSIQQNITAEIIKEDNKGGLVQVSKSKNKDDDSVMKLLSNVSCVKKGYDKARLEDAGSEQGDYIIYKFNCEKVNREIVKAKEETSETVKVASDNKNKNNTLVSEWEASVKIAEENEKNFSCDTHAKRDLKDLLKKNIDLKSFLTKKLNYCIKDSEVLKLGEYKEILNFPKGLIEDTKCKTEICIRQKAGKQVYMIFSQRGEQYYAKYPGEIIKGMAWYELFYLDKLKKAEDSLKRYKDNDYDGLNKIFVNLDSINIHSLIKLNKGRIKMRKALGFDLYDKTAEVISKEWILGEFLNKDELKVTKEKLSSSEKKRKELISKYRTVLNKYRAKLEEEKMRN